MEIEVHADPVSLSAHASATIALAARVAIGARARFLLAVSGGNTPLETLRRLATETIDWQQVHLAQVDERVAPSGSDERNLTHLQAMLLDRVPLPRTHVHSMPVEDIDISAGAQRFARQLEQIAGRPATFDMMLLGLGADGHTASLVPGDPVLDSSAAEVALTEVYRGARRMTLTFPIINRARCVVWLIAGASKAPALAQLIHRDLSIPASHVARERALLLVDRAAFAASSAQRLPADVSVVEH
ncbi:MAG: 6-phosphogluconolactonase [Proteobacteria bacterium]|nr:6-phosphogluconolactonase [Burkholderiales bacterium]